MILDTDNPAFDILKHSPEFRGNPGSAPGVPCFPFSINESNPSRCAVDWSGVRATPQRKNNLCSGYPADDVRAWNSGYPQGVVIGKARRHVIMTQHYVHAVPGEAQNFKFVSSNGMLVESKAEKIIWNAHHDTVIVRLVDPVPDFIASYPVCDVRYCKPGRAVWIRTCQGQSIRMAIAGVGLSDNSAISFTVKPWTYEDGTSGAKIVAVHSGDSGTPAMTVLKDGRTAYVGSLWGSGCVSFGLPNRISTSPGNNPNDWSLTSQNAPGWPRLQSVLAEIGDELEVVYPDFDARDLNSDGVIGAEDLAMIQGAWGTDRYDVSGDGLVDAIDMAEVLAGWGGKVLPAGVSVSSGASQTPIQPV